MYNTCLPMHARHKPEGPIAGERYAGVMPGHDGAASYQLFLLPGEADALSWQAALD